MTKSRGPADPPGPAPPLRERLEPRQERQLAALTAIGVRFITLPSRNGIVRLERTR